MAAKADTTALSRSFAIECGLPGKPAVEFCFDQSWLREKDEAFRPGHVALYPRSGGLVVIASLRDEVIYTDATSGNQPMWELGDVFEIFIAVPSQSKYWELHVTPNNYRLQLEWTEQDFNSFRQKTSLLSDHVISDGGFFTSTTRINRMEAIGKYTFFCRGNPSACRAGGMHTSLN